MIPPVAISQPLQPCIIVIIVTSDFMGHPWCPITVNTQVGKPRLHQYEALHSLRQRQRSGISATVDSPTSHIPILTPHFTSSQFAGYVVANPSTIPICIMNQNTIVEASGRCAAKKTKYVSA